MVDELAEQLRRYGEAVEEQAMASPGGAVSSRTPGRHAGRVLATAAAVCALVVGSVAGWRAIGTDPSEDVQTTSDAPAEEDPGGVRTFRDVPLSARQDAAVVAAGDLVVVWGGSIDGFNVGRPELGSDTYDDGAFVDLRTESWNEMTPSPLPVDESRPVGVWTGELVVVFRGAHAATWDPASNTWVALPPPPAPVTRAFWTGERVIALGADATYRMGDSRWEALPAGPIEPATLLGGAAVAAAWTGDELAVVNKSTSGLVAVAAYDPRTQAWRTLPSHELDVGSTSVGVTWTGTELVVMTLQEVAGLDLQSGQWRTLPAPPVQREEAVPLLVSVDDTVVAHRGLDARIFAGGEWTPFSGDLLPSGHPIEGVDGTVLYFGLDIKASGGMGPEGGALGIVDPRRVVDAGRRGGPSTSLPSADDPLIEPAPPSPETTTSPSPSPSLEAAPRGRLADLPVTTRNDVGIARVGVSFLDGSSLRITGPADLVGEIGQFQVDARAVLYCEPACGYAEAVADLRSAEAGEANSGRFVRRDGDLLAAMSPWLVRVPTKNVAPADISGLVDDLAVEGRTSPWPHLTVPDRMVFDPEETFVDLTRGSDAISIASASCETGVAPTLTPFDDGAEHWSAAACDPQLPVYVTISGSRQFVERVSGELTYERG